MYKEFSDRIFKYECLTQHMFECLATTFLSLITRKLLSPSDTLDLLNTLMEKHNLDTKGKLHAIEKSYTNKPILFYRLHCLILNQAENLEETIELLKNMPHYHILIPNETPLPLLEKHLPVGSPKDIIYFYFSFGYLPDIETIQQITSIEEKRELYALLQEKEYVFLTHIDPEDYNKYLAIVSWEWFYDPRLPLYDQHELAELVKNNSACSYRENLEKRLTYKIPFIDHNKKYGDIRDEIEAHFRKNGYLGVPLDPSLTDKQTQTLSDIYGSLFVHPNPVKFPETITFNKFKSDNQPPPLRPHDPIWALTIETQLIRNEHLFQFKAGHLPEGPNKVRFVLSIFTRPSQYRNHMLINAIGENPLTGNPLIYNFSIDINGTQKQLLDLLEDSPIKEIIKKRIIKEKIACGQLNISSMSYLQIDTLVWSQFSKKSTIGLELINEFIQDTSVSIDDLEKHNQDTKSILNEVKNSQLQSEIHRTIELIGDNLEEKSQENKLDFFNYLIGILQEKPPIIQYYEYIFKTDFSDLSIWISECSRPEKYMLLSTLFFGPSGIFSSPPHVRTLIQNLYHYGFENTATNDTPLFIIFEEGFNACDKFKKLDILVSLFQYFTNEKNAQKVTPLKKKSELIKHILTGFGVVGVKLGQILAQQPNLITDETMKRTLENLSDTAPAIDKRYVLSAIENEPNSEELKQKIAYIGKLIGSASVKQGYEIVLSDGTKWAFKFIRPTSHTEIGDLHTGNLGVVKTVLESPRIQALGTLSDSLIDELTQAIQGELDIEKEVYFQRTIGNYIAQIDNKNSPLGSRKWHIRAPQLHPYLQGQQFFCDEFVIGYPLKEDIIQQLKHDEELTHVADTLYHTLLELILTYGVYHGDLHPGNILIDQANKTIHLIDFGHCGHFNKQNKDTFLKLTKALAQNRPNYAYSALENIISQEDHTKLHDIQTQLHCIIKQRNTSFEEKLIAISALFKTHSITLTPQFELMIKVLDSIQYITQYTSNKKAIFTNIAGRWNLLTA